MLKNVAVVGCGYWGKNLVRNFHELDSLYVISDIDEKLLSDLEKKYQGVIIYTDFEKMLKDPKVEAVVISTPAVTHYSLAKKALLADKDVFVEKPISLRYAEGEELVQLAEERKRILMVGHILEFHPAITKLKEIIDRGDLGRINYIYSNRLNLGKFRTEENILWSFAPHDISVILKILGEMPDAVYANGGSYLNPDIMDVTVTTMDFSSGVKAHIYVSWLHPYKEQRLVVIGEKGMAVFDDVSSGNKLLYYSHKIDWVGRLPVPRKEEAEPIKISNGEPLKLECLNFLECIETRKKPETDGKKGLQVLRILEACQQSFKETKKIMLSGGKNRKYFVHESSILDDNVHVGEGTKIWHFCHILSNTKIGEKCSLGQNVVVGPNVKIGNNVKIQNNVSVYDGVILEDDVFCGPSMVFTNVMNPRSHWPRKDEFKKTLVKKGASLGANSTILCGATIGEYAFIGAGAVVKTDVPDYALVYGVPARIQGWMCFCGTKLDLSDSPDSEEMAVCPECKRQYEKKGKKVTCISEGNS